MPTLLFNPQAGGSRALRQLADELSRHDLRVVEPQDPIALASEVRACVDRGEDRVLVAGGDGTIHAAIQSLAGTACALAPIPLGTGNDFCRSMGVSLDPRNALQRGLAGSIRSIDLGRCDERYFAGIAGTGLDGAVLDFLESRSQFFRGPWVYPYAVARTLLRYRPIDLSILVDDRTVEATVMLAAWANTPIFGGGMRMAPMADPADGLLDLILVERMPKAKLLALFPQVYRGGHIDRPGVVHLQGRQFRIQSAGPLRLHADGELLGESDNGVLTLEVQRAALQVVV